MAITLDGTAGITTPDLTDTSLTTGRVVYTTTSGNLTSSANLLYSGTDMTVYGLTVGRGAGAIATNTAVGSGALQANTTGTISVALGYQAGYGKTTAGANVAIGHQSQYAGTTGDDNVSVGTYALYNNTGANNVAIGSVALGNAANTGSSIVAVGRDALRNNTSGSSNTAVGYQAGYTNTTGGFGVYLGYQAGYTTNATYGNVCIGYRVGYSLTGGGNTLVGGLSTAGGDGAGTALTTGTQNSFFGTSAGNAVTTGSKNAILGSYSGNQGSLDIRTASNYIVLSDGDGNPRGYFNDSGRFTIGATNSSSDRLLVNGPASFGQAADTNVYVGFLGGTNYLSGSGTIRMTVSSGGVQLTSGATSWASASDERLKDIIEPITGAMAKVNTLRTVMGKYKTDAEGTRRPFLIAQDVIAVLPEAVDSVADTREGDETEYMSVRYTDTIPLLIAAIKELKAEFDAYKASQEATT